MRRLLGAAGAFALGAALAALQVGARAGEHRHAELIAVGQSPVVARFAGVRHDGVLRFSPAAEGADDVWVPQDRLVRWGTPSAPRAADVALLRDGTALGLAAAWGAEPTVVLDDRRGQFRTARWGPRQVDRAAVRAILWRLPRDLSRRTVLIDSLLAAQRGRPREDLLALVNGDQYAGKLAAISDRRGAGTAEVEPARITFRSALGELAAPLEQARGVVLAGEETRPPAGLEVGIAEGSHVAVESLAGEAESLRLITRSLGELHSAVDDVAYLQAHGDRFAYLSDRSPTSYEHQPYLELGWPYKTDRNVLGGPLRVGGRSYCKGLGLHSATRLGYRVEERFERFAATIALDDAAEGLGSAVARVLLRSGGEPWREGYASGELRAGQPPQPVAVDLGDATEIQLTVEYGSGGHQRDYVNWLDARLER